MLYIHKRKKEKTLGTQQMEVGEEGERLPIYLSQQCHHQNDSCINLGSDESHFKVSLIVRDSHETVSTNHNLSEQKEEPKPRRPSAYRPNALPLGQTRSHFCGCTCFAWWCQVADLNKLLPVCTNDGAKLVYCASVATYSVILCCRKENVYVYTS